LIYYVKSSTLSNERKKLGAQEKIGPNGRKYGQNGALGRQMGVPLIFVRLFEYTILHNISKNKRNRPVRWEVTPILQFFRPGHPCPDSAKNGTVETYKSLQGKSLQNFKSLRFF